MSWLLRYKIAHFLRRTVWVVPLCGMVVGMVAARVLWRADLALGWTSWVSADVYRTILISLAAVVFTLIVFVSSALLIALQLASAQLTPRIIAFIFADRVMRWALALFMFTFAFMMTVASRVESVVPWITAKCAMYSSVASLAAFLYLIEHLGRALRPSIAMRRLAEVGRDVIKDVYPKPFEQRTETDIDSAELSADNAQAIESARDGVILAIDIDGLAALATRNGVIIELVPQVGDFVTRGEPLFKLLAGSSGAQGTTSIDPGILNDFVAIGLERTPQQDPTLVFRVIVDIACKALSPAINDPTTAVLAIDQIHRLLRDVGLRWLQDERVRDPQGKLRLIYRTPNWDDFVRLAVTEIRQFGSASIQVNRRLRAMLQSLIRTLPERRIPLLKNELALLNKTAERAFADPEDRALAQVGDPQGVGSRHNSVESVAAR